MTDKQIMIIDKPKENKCKFISTTGQCLSPINKSAKYCNEIPEEWCYYKQLKRKEQICERLIDKYKNVCKVCPKNIKCNECSVKDTLEILKGKI